MFIEKPCHNLLGNLGKELPPQVNVVCDRMLELRVAFFLVFLIYNAVRYDFKEARAVHSFRITQMEIHFLTEHIFEMQVRQYIPIPLVSVPVRIPRIPEQISLVRMLGPHAGSQPYVAVFPVAGGIQCGDFLGSVIVERIPDIAVSPRDNADFVEVCPVLAIFLIYSCARAAVK